MDLSWVQFYIYYFQIAMRMTDNAYIGEYRICGFCVRYHSQRLRALEETEERIDLVITWRESPCFTEREQAAFQWTETITRLADHRHVPEKLYEQTRETLSNTIGCVAKHLTSHRLLDRT